MIDYPHCDEEHRVLRKFLLDRGAAAVTENAHLLAWRVDDELLWVTAYDQWCGKTCQMHWASKSPRFLPRAFIHTCFHYAFNGLKLMRVFGQVNTRNPVALRIELWLGFREIYRAPQCHNDGGDIIFLEMRADECKWIRTRDEQRLAAHA